MSEFYQQQVISPIASRENQAYPASVEKSAGQVDFLAGQVTFHCHLSDGQGPRQVLCELNEKKKVN